MVDPIPTIATPSMRDRAPKPAAPSALDQLPIVAAIRLASHLAAASRHHAVLVLAARDADGPAGSLGSAIARGALPDFGCDHRR